MSTNLRKLTYDEKIFNINRYTKWRKKGNLLFSEFIPSNRPSNELLLSPDNSTRISALQSINDLDELVYSILSMSKYFCSYRMNKAGAFIFETGRMRNRSSLDIWRHAKEFMPKVTLPEVMASLYSISNDKDLGIISQYCNVVRRRVFYIGSSAYNFSPTTLDEYRLLFNDWKDINKLPISVEPTSETILI